MEVSEAAMTVINTGVFWVMVVFIQRKNEHARKLDKDFELQ